MATKRRFHIGWITEVTDVAPRRNQDGVLQLQNELRPFVKFKDGLVTIKVVGDKK